jgi:phosphate transport system permease protein
MKTNNYSQDSRLPQIIFFICAVVAVIMLLLITIFMFSQSIPAIREVGLWNMLSGTVWKPTADVPSYGILPMILSSLAATFGAIVLGVPIGLLTAVFLSKISPKPLTKLMIPIVDLLAGIPSVIYGFMGLILLMPLVADVFNVAYGGTLLTAIIILAIMILPTIISISKTSLESVPPTYEEASLALGATKIQTIFKIIVPAAHSGILSGVILGVGRAIGETMAVILVSGNAVNMPKLLGSVRLLTSGIVSEMSYADAFHRQVLFAIGLVLFVFIMIINLVLNLVIKNTNKAYE